MPDLVLFDGVCGLCNRVNRFILRRDRRDRFRFAALQGALAAGLLARHGCDAAGLDTSYVIADWGGPQERLFCKGRGALYVLRALGGVWSLAVVLAPLPTCLLDTVYDFIAGRRYRWFGRYDVCPLPAPEHRAKFVDAA